LKIAHTLEMRLRQCGEVGVELGNQCLALLLDTRVDGCDFRFSPLINCRAVFLQTFGCPRAD
jgi:hypothetical protein